jgi:hypothetical protein
VDTASMRVRLLAQLAEAAALAADATLCVEQLHAGDLDTLCSSKPWRTSTRPGNAYGRR